MFLRFLIHLLMVTLLSNHNSYAKTIEEIIADLEMQIARDEGKQDIVINANIVKDIIDRDDLDLDSYETKNSIVRIVVSDHKKNTYKFSGSYDIAIMIPMLDTDLEAGNIINERHIVMMKWQKRHNSSKYIKDPEDIIGMQNNVRLKSYTPIKINQIGKISKIEKGMLVDVKFMRNGLIISSKLEALENGSIGDTIRLRNESGKVIYGVINEDGGASIADD